MAELIRGQGAYGRRPVRSVLHRLSQDAPVQVFTPESDGGFSIETVQDVEPILKANVAEYNSGHNGYTPSGDLKKVASIPLIEVHKLLNLGINIFNEDDWPKVIAKLDDPEWLKFRTAPGRLSRKPNREYCRASTGK